MANFCQLTDCQPDRSDCNLVETNDIAGTTAEAVDIEEGASDGVLRSNTFDSVAMVEANSWVDVKGNAWRIEGNTRTSTAADGFEVHEVVDGWGRDPSPPATRSTVSRGWRSTSPGHGRSGTPRR